MTNKYKEKILNFLKRMHTILLLGEEGDATSWIILGFFTVLYLGFSLGLVTQFGTTLVYEYTKFRHDNAAHLYIARSLLDNGLYSKLANLGTVWLPLYHLVIAPLTLINFLYTTGLAGALFNSIFIATTASLVYLTVKGETGLIMSIAYGFSMYSLVHASSSYMVPIGQFLALSATYYTLQYIEEGSLKELTKAVAFAMLASTARYEAWLVLIAITLVILLNEFKSRSWIIASHIPLLWTGVAGWFIYNWAIFGHPLMFIWGRFPGASGYYSKLIHYLLHPWKADYSLIVSILSSLGGSLAAFFLLIGVIGVVVSRERVRKRVSILILLYAPLLLLLISSKEILILDLPLYFYFISPWIFIITGKTLQSIRYHYNSNIAYAALLILFLIGYTVVQSTEYNSLAENLGYAAPRLNHDVVNARYIASLQAVKGGYIASPISTTSAKLSVLGDLSPSIIIDSFDSTLYINASREPWNNNVTVVLIPSIDYYLRIKPYISSLSDNQHYAIQFYENQTWRNLFLQQYTQVASLEIDGDMVQVYIKTS